MNFKEKLEEVLLQFNPKELHIKGPKKYRFSDTTKNDFFEFVAPTCINLYSHQIQFSDALQLEKIFGDFFQKIVIELLMNKLRKCSIFAIPNHRNDIAALRVGLIPFMYENEFYLAAENNVDHDPKYEAYYAVTHGALFADSIYAPDVEENWNYFKTIVGEKVAKEVEEAISLSEKEYDIHIVI